MWRTALRAHGDPGAGQRTEGLARTHTIMGPGASVDSSSIPRGGGEFLAAADVGRSDRE